MPRIFRILPQEGFLHIITRGNNRQNIFKNNEDYNTYLEHLKQYKPENKISICHYCIMPNHAHLIVEVNKNSSLDRFVKQVNLSYFYYYKKRYKYNGHLWQGRYKSFIISTDGYLITCGRYIELNPVRAKIVRLPEEYEWSSYKVYAYGKDNGIVDYNPIYMELGKTEEGRRKNYRKDILEEMKRVKINFNARYYGTLEFIKKMEKKFKINNLKAKRGRPKKQ